MSLSIFHVESRRIFREVRGQASPFGHAFGGATAYRGLQAFADQPPLHLLYRLNTADPDAGVRLPGAKWLPLLCALRYGGCGLGYRVLSDDAVQILHQREQAAWESYPSDDCPESLPVQPLTLREERYDPSRVADALGYAGVFGYGAFSPAQYDEIVRWVAAQEGLAEAYFCETPEQYVSECGAPFAQGVPLEGCPDPACANHAAESSLRTFAIYHEPQAAAGSLWGRNGGPQLAYQICPACSAIRVVNQAG